MCGTDLLNNLMFRYSKHLKYRIDEVMEIIIPEVFLEHDNMVVFDFRVFPDYSEFLIIGNFA